MLKKIWYLSLFLLVAVSDEKYLYSHSHSHSHDHDEHHHFEDHDSHFISISQDQIDHLNISVHECKEGELCFTLFTRGKIILHPDRLIHVLPKISGVAVETFKNIGDETKRGDLLAILESREIAEVKAEYLGAVEKETLALSLLEREKRLFEKRISPEQDYLNARSAYQETKIHAQLAKQKLYAFGLTDQEIVELQNTSDLRMYAIRSPIDGTIIDRHISKGEFIETTATIYQIADLSTVWAEIGIYPKDLHRIKEGQTVSIDHPLEKGDVTAKIIYVSPIIEDDTITSKAIGEINNAGKTWRPGTFVKVAIATEKIPASIVIPKEAVQKIEGENCVFVKVAEGFERRPIQIGKKDDNNVEVISGLELGEAFAASNTFFLKAELGKHDVEHEH